MSDMSDMSMKERLLRALYYDSEFYWLDEDPYGWMLFDPRFRDYPVREEERGEQPAADEVPTTATTAGEEGGQSWLGGVLQGIAAIFRAGADSSVRLSRE